MRPDKGRALATEKRGKGQMSKNKPAGEAGLKARAKQLKDPASPAF
jgi:hypothetical protein